MTGFDGPIPVAPGHALVVTEAVAGLTVKEGGVEVFVTLLEDGDTVLWREPVAHLTTGDVIPGLPAATDTLRFEVVSAGRAAVRLGVAEMEQAQRWFEHLLSTLSRLSRAPRGGDAVLEPGERRAFRPGARVVIGRGSAWVRDESGATRLLDLDSGPEWLPLADGAWLQTGPEESILEAVGLAEVLARDHGSDAVVTAHAWLLERLGRALDQVVRRQGDRIRDSIDQRAAEHRGAITSLLSLATETEHVVDGAADPLVAALRHVGAALGTRIVVPGGLGAEPSDGARLEMLCEASDLRARRVTLRGVWWRDDAGPLLAFHRDRPAPVALIPESGRRYRMIDPADGSSRVVDRTVAETLSPLARSFYRCLPGRALRLGDLFSFVYGANRSDIAALLGLGALSGLIGLAIPAATALVFDHLIPGHMSSQILVLGGGLAVAALVLLVFRLAQGVASQRIETRIAGSLQAAIMDRVMRLPASFLREQAAGDLANRALVVERIASLVTGTLVSSLLGGVFSVFVFGLLFVYAPIAAAVALALSLCLALVTAHAGYLSLVALMHREEATGRLASLVLEMVNGLVRIRLAGAEERQFARWADRFTDMRRHMLRAQQVRARLLTFTAAFRPLAMALVFAVIVLTQKDIGTGAFLAFVAGLSSALSSVSQMVEAVVDLFLVVPMLRRARPILATSPESAGGKAGPGQLSGDVEAVDLTFRYAPDLPLVLKGMSFRVRSGEFVAVVGRSGSGKSTLFRLLLGFEAPESGGIFYDGKEITGLDLRGLRRQVGTVLQHDVLFPGSIYDNIRGATAIEVEEAWQAARLAGLAEDIDALPMGMHTVITEGFSTFSGGQIQRLLIARALARRPRILLFDEATSALDNRAQAVVAEGLARLPVTRIVIAHRLSTVEGADRIYVLDDGIVVEQGSFGDLLAMNGVFADLARRQLL